MIRIEALTHRPTRIKGFDTEYQYYKGTVVLETGGLGLEFEATVDQFFGTDSILEQQKEERYSDKRRALEILTADERDRKLMFENLDYAPALQLLSGEGPITAFSERIKSQPLTSEQVTLVEETMMTGRVLESLYGLRGKIRSFKRRRRGFTESALIMKCPSESWFDRSSASGTYSPNHELEVGNTVYPIYKVELDYQNKKLSFERHWLTACAKNSAAIAFINHWESVSPEDRLADFVSQVCTLSGMTPRLLASDKI